MDRGEIKYLLSLGQIVGMNQTLVTILMDAFGDAERAWSEYSRWADVLPLSKGKRTSLVEARSEVSPEAVEEYRRRLGVKITVCDDDDFPDLLRNVENPPYYLYYFGNLPDPDLLSIFTSHKTGQCPCRIIQIIHRLDFLPTGSFPLSVLPFRLKHLNVCAVLQHNVTQIRRRSRRENLSPESILEQ